jgi:hypothetical protein
VSLTPTQLSLRHLRDQGWELVEVVERWNPHARIRQDMFGLLDIVAVDGATLGVQTTSASNVSARVRKLRDADATGVLLRSGWDLVVHGWAKKGGRWVLQREVEITESGWKGTE